jgi:hypothetical protein
VNDKVKNAKIDKALKSMMDLIDHDDEKKRLPPDTAIKVIAQAIAWEKAKHGRVGKDGDDGSEFDPRNL